MPIDRSNTIDDVTSLTDRPSFWSTVMNANILAPLPHWFRDKSMHGASSLRNLTYKSMMLARRGEARSIWPKARLEA